MCVIFSIFPVELTSTYDVFSILQMNIGTLIVKFGVSLRVVSCNSYVRIRYTRYPNKVNYSHLRHGDGYIHHTNSVAYALIRIGN